MIGYMCAYLRYYYPHEFITAYLNNAANEDDLSAGCSLAKDYGIRMLPPQFGLSTDEYVFDKEKNVIAMGVSSIKFLNKGAAKQLYSLGKKKYTSFIDLLYEIANSTGVDARKLDVLIKVGYFSKFGNISTLLGIVEAFDYFKQGDAKKVKKDSDCPYMTSVKKFSTDIGKSGKESKSYNITDCRALLLDIEREIINAELPDIPWAQRVQWQVEFTGSILHTGDAKDRWYVYIKELYPARRKSDNKQFGYNVVLQSLGSGKQSKMTVFNKDFNRCPFDVGNIIKIRNPGGWERKGQYFNLTGYDIIG